MTTKAEFITQLKAENPTIKVGSDGNYTQLNTVEYEAKISEWADAKVAQEAKKAEQDAIDVQFAKDKASAEAKLISYGLNMAEIKANRGEKARVL